MCSDYVSFCLAVAAGARRQLFFLDILGSDGDSSSSEESDLSKAGGGGAVDMPLPSKET